MKMWKVLLRESLTLGAVLASYLALWIKRCIVPSVLREYLSLKDLYPAILLASKKILRLTPG